MPTLSVELGAKNQITPPKSVREELNIKSGDRLLMDVQDGILVLIPKPGLYTKSLKGLHSEIWKDVDVKKYFDEERDAWVRSASG